MIKDLKKRRTARPPESKKARQQYRNVIHRQNTRHEDLKMLVGRRREITPRISDAERVLSSPALDHNSRRMINEQTMIPLTTELRSLDQRLYTTLRNYQLEHPRMEARAARIMNEELALRGEQYEHRLDKDYWRRVIGAVLHKEKTRGIGVAWDDRRRTIVDYGGPLPEHKPLFG